MKITTRALNRATLDRQLLLKRESMEAVAASRRVVALQAQEPASPYLATGSGRVSRPPGSPSATPTR